MSHDSSPILVTGSHRSGTTWVGQMLAAGPEVGYVYEPFNVGPGISCNPHPFSAWFVGLDGTDDAVRRADFQAILGFRYPVVSNLGRLRGAKDAARLLRNLALSLRHRAQGRRPLLKDPIALFSAEWLARHFAASVVVMIRHPAAFCSSLKLKQWTFNFADLAGQPGLMAGPLAPMRGEIEQAVRSDLPLLEQAILLWNCIHLTIAGYQERHPDWHFVRHEDCSRDPLGSFQSLYAALGLTFTEQVRATILASSGADNPTEQARGQEFRRNSLLNIDNWRRRLTADEAALVRHRTGELADRWYGDESW